MVPGYILFFYSSLALHIVSATDTAVVLLKDPETIVSGNGHFKLGFFSPSNSENRYLGIWYDHVSVMDFVWVANRNNPLSDSSGVLRLSEDGNLQVLNGRKDVIWSSNVSQPVANTSRTAKLSDSGNFCLLELSMDLTSSSNGTVIWQSFDHPTDSILPSTKLSMSSSNMRQRLQSWKSPSDPSYGRFSLGTDSLTHSQIFIWDGDRPHWRSGPWNGNIFLGLLYTGVPNDYANTHMQQNGEAEVDFVYTGVSKLAFSHYAFSYDGTLNEIWWDQSKRAWETVYRAPDDNCDFYNKCGAFATCNSLESPICQCLRGFRPKNSEEWSSGNWSGGCVRRTSLKCGTAGNQREGFLVVKRVKPPDLAEWLAGLSQTDCRTQCLENCSCLAYAYDVGAGCMYWSRDLIDIQELPSDGVDLYIRLPESELGDNHKSKAVIAGVILGTGSIAIILCLFWWFKTRRKEREVRRNSRKTMMLENHHRGEGRSQCRVEELPQLRYENLAVATNNFHESNKLGKGGFGQVYKGRMKDGQEIAVKRLSETSGQGLQEFTNEVVVISRLQHRNLVRLLGFCAEGGEKMLVYEYMPNKSLDVFLFDPVKQKLLDWGKRFNIIEGICRGLIYLHRDSRLRIIHRDLKASNILLDEELNPKISDFGMARIFMDNQDQHETRRVVGTYGYMSPEYAMEGHFSEKSDVFSFGVLVLEIVTGCRNSTFWIEEQSLTLLGYTWKLWAENNVASIIDPAISDPIFRNDIERCIQVGLLCVQEYVKDRPSVATVLSMLVSEIVDLPYPKQPGFSKRLTAWDTSSSGSQIQQNSSASSISITYLSGR